MPEPTALTDQIAADLRRYFALTTTVPLPRRITEMTAHSVGRSPRRRPNGALLGATGLLAALALVVLGTARLASISSSQSSSLDARSGLGLAFRPASPAAVSYPGLDAAALQRVGVVLLPAAGQKGVESNQPAQVQAQAAAAAAAGAYAGTTGPAVLADAEIPARSITCVCWVVEVPVPGPSPSAAGAGGAALELVLVDARLGRVVATVAVPPA